MHPRTPPGIRQSVRENSDGTRRNVAPERSPPASAASIFEPASGVLVTALGVVVGQGLELPPITIETQGFRVTIHVERA